MGERSKPDEKRAKQWAEWIILLWLHGYGATSRGIVLMQVPGGNTEGEVRGRKTEGEVRGGKTEGEVPGRKTEGEVRGRKTEGEVRGGKTEGEVRGGKTELCHAVQPFPVTVSPLLYTSDYLGQRSMAPPGEAGGGGSSIICEFEGGVWGTGLRGQT